RSCGWRRKKASLEAKEGVVGGGRRRRWRRKKAFLTWRMVKMKKEENRREYIGEGENRAGEWRRRNSRQYPF
uniref:Uncharacterized protein n=1 Tax=Cucumis melo TaxID=3656 RepID=A0A9I9E6L0_CUCME